MKRAFVGSLIIAAAVGIAVTAAAQEQSYISAAKCKMCHKIQFESWSATRHAQATETAKASTQWKYEPACLSCHATNADEELAGVQCEACHGPGSSYKSLSIMKDREKAVSAGLVVPTQATCDGCHDGKDHHKKQTFTADVHAHKN